MRACKHVPTTWYNIKSDILSTITLNYIKVHRLAWSKKYVHIFHSCPQNIIISPNTCPMGHKFHNLGRGFHGQHNYAHSLSPFDVDENNSLWVYGYIVPAFVSEPLPNEFHNLWRGLHERHNCAFSFFFQIWKKTRFSKI